MDTVIKNITLIDGAGREPVENAVIAIRERKIIYAGSASGWSEAAGGNVMQIDLPKGLFAKQVLTI